MHIKYIHCSAFLHRAEDEAATRRLDRGVPDSEVDGLEQRVAELNEHDSSEAFIGDSGG